MRVVFHKGDSPSFCYMYIFTTFKIFLATFHMVCMQELWVDVAHDKKLLQLLYLGNTSKPGEY